MKALRIFKQPLTAVDTAWLHMDEPTNLAVICGVITFSDPIRYDRLKEMIESRLMTYPRFRQRIREYRIGPPSWENDPNFVLDNHLNKLELPEPGDQVILQKVMGLLMSVPLDSEKPLWEMHFVEDFEGGSALICRFHHCIADGIALIQLLLSTADTESIEEWERVYDESQELSPLAQMFVPIVKTRRIVRSQKDSLKKIVSFGMNTFIHPKRLYSMALRGQAGGAALSKLLFMPPDNQTILKGKCGIPKKAVWSKSIKVEDVKTVGRSIGGTINDVLIAAITGALRRYIQSRDESIDELDIRAIVPVNLRSVIDIGDLGNQFGLVYLSLPVGEDDAHKRLQLLKTRMDEIKDTPEALAAFGILNFMGISPVKIERMIRDLFGIKGTVVITNVPGPKQSLFMAGGRIDGLMFWVPTPANLSLGISIISYAGDVIIGIASDAGLIPDPENIMEMFLMEFNALKTIAMDQNENMKASSDSKSHSSDEELNNVNENETSDDSEKVRPTSIRDERDDLNTEEESGRCQAMTRRGLRCKNHARPGHVYCHVHGN